MTSANRAVWLAPLIVLLSLTLLPGCARQKPATTCHVGVTDDGPWLQRMRDTWQADPLPADTTQPPITVVYPRGAWPDTVLTVDRVRGIPASGVFLFGHVNDPGGTLRVNGHRCRIHPRGGWLRWVENAPPWSQVVERTLPDGTLLRELPVTLSLKSRSNEKTVERTIVFYDSIRPPTIPIDPWPFVADTARLVVTAEPAKLRCGWPGTNVMMPAPGTALYATGRVHGSRTMWRVPLGNGQIGWIEESEVERDTAWTPAIGRRLSGDGFQPRPRVIHSVNGGSGFKSERIVARIPVGEKRPVQVERLDDHRLQLIVYGAVSWTDLVLQPLQSRVVDEYRWSQLDATTWSLTAYIHPEWFRGWEVSWGEDGTLFWIINQIRPVDPDQPLAGRILVIDPGHGGDDYSAIGPTGETEKDANLALSRHVVRALKEAGARVLVTRDDDRTIALYDRVAFARELKPDAIVSLHHNALPQGVNPSNSRGASTHYVHRHSLPLARSIFGAIREERWPTNRLRYQDLAIPRASFCPSVLIEGGFLMHPAEEQLIMSDEYREAMAEWITTGLTAYFADVAAAQRTMMNEYDD